MTPEAEALSRSCLSKARYSTRKAAKEARAVARRQTGNVVRFYRCRLCGHYHLTKTPKRPWRKAKA